MTTTNESHKVTVNLGKARLVVMDRKSVSVNQKRDFTKIGIGAPYTAVDAFTTRCGQPSSSKEYSKYYTQIPNPGLFDIYVLNPRVILWNDERSITTWDELKSFIEGVPAGERYDAILQNDITVPAGAAGIDIPLVDNAVVRIRSETGQNFKIDFNGATSYIRWVGTSSLNNYFALENLTLTNIVTTQPLMRFENIAGFLMNEVTVENVDVYLHTFYVRNTPLAVGSCVFRDLVGNTAYGVVFHSMTSETLFYNCVFQNITSNSGGGAVYFNSRLSGSNFGITLLGCLFEDCTTPQSDAGLYCGFNDSTVFIGNCVFKNNSAGQDTGALTLLAGNSATTTYLVIDCEFSGNMAGTEGGAISMKYDNVRLEIIGESCFNGNEAGTDGGAIAVADTEIEYLTVEDTVEFSNNIAGSAYIIADADIPAYDSKIAATNFSERLQYGWNNYDIQYTRGQELKIVNVQVANCTQTIRTNKLGRIPPNATVDPDCVPLGMEFKAFYLDASLTIPITPYTSLFAGDTLYAKFVPESECKCCDCLNDDMKVAFEMLAGTIGESHVAAQYILQIIVDKLTDPLNTCTLQDFAGMFEELTKLTGYNQKELCCILSAMTGMEVSM